MFAVGTWCGLPHGGIMTQFLLNALIAPTVVLAVAVAALIGLAIVLFMQKKSGQKYIEVIKNKLTAIAKDEPSKMTITASDTINRIMLDIDTLGETLNKHAKKYANQKDNLLAIVENMSFAILALDEDNRVILSNQVAKDFFNFTQDGHNVGTAIRSLTFLNKLKTVQEKREVTTFDIVERTGEVFEVKILPANTKKINLLITAQQVTQIRKLEQEKQDFFLNASHELSTPLTSVLGYAEMMQLEKKYNPDFIAAIMSQAERMRALVEDMLSIVGADSGVAEVAPSLLDVSVIALELIETQKPIAKAKEITLKPCIEPDIAFVAHESKWIELLSNLISNAIKYTPNGGKVTVSLTKGAEGIVLKVKDTGMGIPSNHLPRIFERFYRVDKSRSTRGTGLGLAIVKSICNLYGAVLSVKSQEGVGTTFTVRFS